ncbi:hypothetical protein TYRP_022559 [Tyrophagus putrescentiae]|nr:hypothetical protein TYRP_022559 [Tyrophagus putrescentiae]
MPTHRVRSIYIGESDEFASLGLSDTKHRVRSIYIGESDEFASLGLSDTESAPSTLVSRTNSHPSDAQTPSPLSLHW